MAHSAVWCYLPIQKQNKNSKELMEAKLSEDVLSRYTKFGRAHLNEQEKIRHLLIWHFYGISLFNMGDIINSKY